MPAPIEFYFDFSSPYGYLGSHMIEPVAARHGRSVEWKPYLIGAVFKVAGTQPLTAYPLKGEYSKHDFARTARLHSIPFRLPAKFPVGSVAAARGHYWLADTAPERAPTYAKAIYAAYFADGRDISDAAVVADIAGEAGIDRAAFLTGIEQPEIKAKLKDATDSAIARGVFGAPFFFVDGEPFWGADRIDMVDRWLATGGW